MTEADTEAEGDENTNFLFTFKNKKPPKRVVFCLRLGVIFVIFFHIERVVVGNVPESLVVKYIERVVQW